MHSLLFCYYLKICTIMQDLVSSKIMSAQKTVQEISTL